jgi:hypothetical protein
MTAGILVSIRLKLRTLEISHICRIFVKIRVKQDLYIIVIMLHE